MTDAEPPPADSPVSRSHDPSDHSLLRRFRGGSEDAATELYTRYAHRLRALAKAQSSPELARRVEVDDLVQSVFKSFFRRASQGLYDVPASEELWKLFLVIALNKIRAKGAFHKAAKRDVRRTTGGELIEEVAEGLASAPKEEPAFLQMVVHEALECLPEQQRKVVEFRIQGYEVAEIAEITGRSKRTVERLLQESRKKLAHLLQEETGHVSEER